MMPRFSKWFVLPIALLVAPALHAQTAPPVSNTWSTICNIIKPGTTGDMMANESKWSRALEMLPAFPGAFAFVSASGAPAACWIANVNNMEGFGKAMGAAAPVSQRFEGASKAYVQDTRSYVARTRPDLKAASSNLGLLRAMNWITFQVRPGQEAAFENAVKAFSAARDRAKLRNDNWGVLQVTHGAPRGTYWVLVAIEDMKQMDEAVAEDPKLAAVFTADDLKAFGTFDASLVSQREELWMVEPTISILPAAMRKQMGDFWKLPATPAKK
jgi:hypothetical protein